MLWKKKIRNTYFLYRRRGESSPDENDRNSESESGSRERQVTVERGIILREELSYCRKRTHHNTSKLSSNPCLLDILDQRSKIFGVQLEKEHNLIELFLLKGIASGDDFHSWIDIPLNLKFKGHKGGSAYWWTLAFNPWKAQVWNWVDKLERELGMTESISSVVPTSPLHHRKLRKAQEMSRHKN